MSAARFIATNQYPDHNMIAKFKRENAKAFQAAFTQILMLAKELNILKNGMARAVAPENRPDVEDREQDPVSCAPLPARGHGGDSRRPSRRTQSAISWLVQGWLIAVVFNFFQP